MKQLLSTLIGVIALSLPATAQWAYFSAPASRVAIGDISITGDSLTIEALVCLKNYSPAQTVNDIVSKHHGPPDLSYLLRPNDFAIQTTSGIHSVSHNYPLCFDSTYHLAGTYDGDSLRFFINGSVVATQACTGTIFQNTLTTSIGLESPGANYQEQFIGYISELRIWKTARTASELQASMYGLPNPASQAGLVACYTFSNGYQNQQGNTAYDGVPDGDSISYAANPHFQGSVSRSFCFPVTAVNEHVTAASELSVYPNPVLSELHVSYKAGTAAPAVLTLTNSTGAVLLNESFYPGDHTVSLDHYPAGIYLIRLVTGKGIWTQKVIRE